MISESRLPVPVLAVDDRPENLLALEGILQGAEIDLTCVGSGQEALRLAFRKPFALILLDVQMPGMDGFEVAEYLRTNPLTSQIPIIFVTAGLGEEISRFKGYEAGAVDYILKPIISWMLLSKVRVFCDLYRQRLDIESQRDRLAQEVVQKTAELVQAQKMEILGRLASGVAHDFNNQLNAILGFAQLGQMEPGISSEVREYFSEIASVALRSADLTRQLLTFSRRQITQMRPASLSATIKPLEKMLRRLIGDQISLEYKFDLQADHILLDRPMIEQVVMNLVVNARDAMVGDGFIRLETSPAKLDSEYCKKHSNVSPGDYVKLEVTDTGSGMSPGVLARIFEPFFTTKELGKGTGLGLAMVYGAVQKHHANIEALSVVGKGSSFIIYFPRIPESFVMPEEKVEVDENSAGWETILLVEDNPVVNRIEKALLEKLGYNVLSCFSPEDALDKAKSYPKPIHLVMTDFMMPGMNGMELVAQIRKFSPKMKVLCASGCAVESIDWLDEKDIVFLGKPFSLKQLATALRSLLS